MAESNSKTDSGSEAQKNKNIRDRILSTGMTASRCNTELTEQARKDWNGWMSVVKLQGTKISLMTSAITMFCTYAPNNIRIGIEKEIQELIHRLEQYRLDEEQVILIEDDVVLPDSESATSHERYLVPRSRKLYIDYLNQLTAGLSRIMIKYLNQPVDTVTEDNLSDIRASLNKLTKMGEAGISALDTLNQKADDIRNTQNVIIQTVKDTEQKTSRKLGEKFSTYMRGADETTGRLRKPGGGRKPLNDTNGAQCKQLWDYMQKHPQSTPSDAAGAVILKGCPESINPYAYADNMTPRDKVNLRFGFVRRFKRWCEAAGKQNPFTNTDE